MVDIIAKVPVREGLFTWPSEHPKILVSKCSVCGELAFPQQDFCPECCTETMQPAVLSDKGKLISFSGMATAPPGFKGTVPYTVGVVEFPEGIRILGLTTEKTVESLTAGMKVEVIIDTAFVEENKEFVTYKYKPVTQKEG